MTLLPQFETSNATSKRTPAWSLSINDNNVTTELSKRIVSLTLTDNPGFEADILNLTLDDADGALEIPSKGAKVSLKIGWADAPLIDKGQFIVDTISHTGTPDKLTLSAKSADFRESLLDRKSVSYKKQTIGSLIATIAGKHGLKSKVSPSLAGVMLVHKIQSNESDANLVTRLADEHDAIAQIKNDTLVFIEAGGTQNASGKDLGTITITRQDGDQHHFRFSEREKITGVKAYWYDVRKAKKQWVTAGEKGKMQSLKKQFVDKVSAQKAAEAELKRLNRGVAEFSLRLAFAMPHLFPKVGVTVQGFKPKIDSTAWKVTHAVHELGESGFTTMVDCELKDEKG